MQRIKTKKLKLGIVGGGPNSWIGHVHRISSRFDDQYEIVAGVFSRNPKLSIKFGTPQQEIKISASFDISLILSVWILQRVVVAPAWRNNKERRRNS